MITCNSSMQTLTSNFHKKLGSARVKRHLDWCILVASNSLSWSCPRFASTLHEMHSVFSVPPGIFGDFDLFDFEGEDPYLAFSTDHKDSWLVI